MLKLEEILSGQGVLGKLSVPFSETIEYCGLKLWIDLRVDYSKYPSKGSTDIGIHPVQNSGGYHWRSPGCSYRLGIYIPPGSKSDEIEARIRDGLEHIKTDLDVMTEYGKKADD